MRAYCALKVGSSLKCMPIHVCTVKPGSFCNCTAACLASFSRPVKALAAAKSTSGNQFSGAPVIALLHHSIGLFPMRQMRMEMANLELPRGDERIART